MNKLFAVILSLTLIIAPVPVVSNARAADMGGYAKIILGMGNSIIGSAVIFKCKLAPMQPSIMAYMAGSLVYVAAEVLGGKAKVSSTKDNAKKLDELKAQSKDGGGDYQKAAVQAQLDDQESNLSHIQKKRKWMMATKVVYMAAVGLAVVELIRSMYPLNIPDAGACVGDGVSHLGTEMAIFAAYNAAQGYASMGLMGAGLAAAGTYGLQFLAKVSIAGKATDLAVSILNSAAGRIGFFIGATALVMLIDGGLAKQESDTKKKIADLKKLLDQFETSKTSLVAGSSSEATAGSGGGVTTGAGAGGLNDPTSKNYAIKPLDKGVSVAKHCYSNSGSQGLTYSENCSKPYQMPKSNFDVNMDIPTLRGIANTATDMANAVSSGDSAAADVAAGSLSSQAGRLEAINKELLKKVNDRLAKDGKKTIDTDPKGYITKQINDLNAALNKQNPGSGNFSLADVTDGGEAAVSASDKVEAAPAVQAAGTSESVGVGGAGVDLSGIESAADAAGGVDPNAEKVASLSDSLDGFESNENDISNKSDVSIFKQLSNRYILNYTKIFERKKVEVPLAPAPEQNK